MITIQAEEHELFLRSIDFDNINDSEIAIEYITIDRNGHRIKWKGLIGKDDDKRKYYVDYHDGFIAWYCNDACHRDGDLPAIIRADDTREWYVRGKLHRVGDLPAIIRVNGHQVWYIRGKCRRNNDLPAVVRAGDNQL